MKTLPLVACLLSVISPVLAADSANDSPPAEGQKLAPYEVTASPFGYLGIKHASARYDLFRWATFQGGLAYLQIDEFYPDSPALSAGIRQGDWIIGINGKPIGKWSFSQLKRFGETQEIGQHIRVDIYRPSDRSDFHADVVVTRKPKANPVSS
jgi:C-terminal processing protease CtpA/Prc